MRIRLLLFCFLLPIIVISQDRAIDSLRNELKKGAHDSLNVFTLLRIGLTYFYSQPDSALHFAEQARQLAQSIHFKKGEAQSTVIIGNIYFETGNYLKAMETQLTALKLHEKRKDKAGIAAVYSNIARIYQEQEDFPNSIGYLMKAEKLFGELKRDEDLLVTTLNIGYGYEQMDLLDSALVFSDSAYRLALRIEDVDNIGTILTNLGNIHYKQRDYATALQQYQASLPYLIAIEDTKSRADGEFGISQVFYRTGRLDSAIHHGKLSLAFARESSHPEGIQQAASLLSRVYDSTRQTDSAYTYFKIATVTRDTLFNAEIVRKVETMNMEEQFRQQELEQERIKARKERKENLQMLGIAVFIVIFFAVILFLSRRKFKHKAMKYLGVLALLLFFEFLNFFLHPHIANITHHIPIYMMLIIVALAAILVPVHHHLEEWIKRKLSHEHTHTSHH